MKKNELYTVTIEDMTHAGEGVGKVDGFPLFIKDAIIGDVVKVKVTKCKNTYGYGHLQEVVLPSAKRSNPPCPIHKACGGCQLQAMRYDAQLEFKENLVKNNLSRIGGFAEEILTKMEPIVGMEEPFYYRNKAQFPIGIKDGQVVSGFYAGRTHDIIPCDDCFLGAKENAKILTTILNYMREQGVTAYDENTGKGIMRHVLLRNGFFTGERMVCLVANAVELPAEDRLCQMLCAIDPQIRSITLSSNMQKTNVITRGWRILCNLGHLQ